MCSPEEARAWQNFRLWTISRTGEAHGSGWKRRSTHAACSRRPSSTRTCAPREDWVPQNGAAWWRRRGPIRRSGGASSRTARGVTELGLSLPAHHATSSRRERRRCTTSSAAHSARAPRTRSSALPPDWYKDFEYRAPRRAPVAARCCARGARPAGPDVEIKVWTRRPIRATWCCRCDGGHGKLEQEQLAAIVTKDAMIGSRGSSRGRHARPWRQAAARPVRHSPKAEVFHAEGRQRANALLPFAVKHGFLNMDEYRHTIERMEPRHYLSAGYYERSLTRLLTLWSKKASSRAKSSAPRGGAIPLSRPSAPRPPQRPPASASARRRVRVKEDFVPGPHPHAPPTFARPASWLPKPRSIPPRRACARREGGRRAHLRCAIPREDLWRTAPIGAVCTSFPELPGTLRLGGLPRRLRQRKSPR